MNKNFAKENVILEAVNLVLSGDNSDSGTNISPIRTYVVDGNNISQKGVNRNLSYPSVTFDCESQASSIPLPTGKYMLVVTASGKTNVDNYKTVVRNILARVEYLFNNAPETLNSAVSKNLRCRTIVRKNVYDESDLEANIYRKSIMFDLICDDELLN